MSNPRLNARAILKEWGIKNFRVIDKKAISEITLGASILATGGGGDPEIGLLWTYKVIDEGKEILERRLSSRRSHQVERC
jgi:hypothetical protein